MKFTPDSNNSLFCSTIESKKFHAKTITASGIFERQYSLLLLGIFTPGMYFSCFRSLSSIIYFVFIIKLYEYLKYFCNHNFFVNKILGDEEYENIENYPNKYISLFSIIITAFLFLSIHTYSIYYLLSLTFIILLRSSIFFKQNIK